MWSSEQKWWWHTRGNKHVLATVIVDNRDRDLVQDVRHPTPCHVINYLDDKDDNDCDHDDYFKDEDETHHTRVFPSRWQCPRRPGTSRCCPWSAGWWWWSFFWCWWLPGHTDGDHVGLSLDGVFQLKDCNVVLKGGSLVVLVDHHPFHLWTGKIRMHPLCEHHWSFPCWLLPSSPLWTSSHWGPICHTRQLQRAMMRGIWRRNYIS